MITHEVKQVDLWDGGDRTNFGFFIDPEVPDEDIEEQYKHSLVRRKVLTIFSSLEEVKLNSITELRRSAWRKLTLQERVALNMIEEPR